MHRDVKLENIAWSEEDGVFPLMDFGGCCRQNLRNIFRIFYYRWVAGQD
jgi:serine/threonine protein kinase